MRVEPLIWAGCVMGQVMALAVDGELLDVDGRRRLGRFVAPAHAAAAHRELVDLNAERLLFGVFLGCSARRLCGRRYLFCSTRGRIAGQQVELARSIARHREPGRDQRDLAEVRHAFQWPDVGQTELERVERQQVAAERVGDLGLVRLDGAGDLEARSLRPLEVDLEIGVQEA